MEYWSWRGPQWVARVRVVLDGVEPVIERVVEVDSTLSAFDLHTVVQRAFGWNDSHLHEFSPGGTGGDTWRSGSREIGLVVADTCDEEWDLPWWIEALDELEITVGQLFALGRGLVSYRYDFGDGWTHTMTLTDCVEPTQWSPRAAVIRGVGPSALDDVGGGAGLTQLLLALGDPGHPRHDHAWDEVRFRATANTEGYLVSSRTLVAGQQDVREMSEELQRVFGLMVPAFG